jgi:hypothetical protein
MPRITAGLGIVLIVLGLGGFLGTRMVSWTALIPAFFGLPLLVLGVLAARRRAWRPHLMHAAVALALLGLAGNVPALSKAGTLIRGGALERPSAVVLRCVMAVLCLAYAGLAVSSFISARRLRRTGPAEQGEESPALR